MKRMILSLIAAGLIVTGASSVRAADWYYDDGDGYGITYVVPTYPAPIYAVPRYRVPIVAPVVRPIVRAPVATAVRAPVAVVRRVAPVARATRFVGRRVLLRY